MTVVLTIGKEYEFSQYFFEDCFLSDYKSADGSGPSELSTPPFKSFWEAIQFELGLWKIYGRLLREYYQGDEEQKGNHFHWKIRDDYESFYYLYCWSAVTSELFRKLLTHYGYFRNSLDRWCNYIALNIDKEWFKDYEGRRYRSVTPNRNLSILFMRFLNYCLPNLLGERGSQQGMSFYSLYEIFELLWVLERGGFYSF